jgi:hypothetical protein
VQFHGPTLSLLLFLSVAGGPAGAQTAPSIESIDPISGRVRTVVTVSGRNFTADNTVEFGGTTIRHVGINSAIAIACAINSTCRSGIIQTLKFKVPPGIRPGPTKVSVKNANGTSNAVDFTVLK